MLKWSKQHFSSEDQVYLQRNIFNPRGNVLPKKDEGAMEKCQVIQSGRRFGAQKE
jgi:hypothetical protein